MYVGIKDKDFEMISFSKILCLALAFKFELLLTNDFNVKEAKICNDSSYFIKVWSSFLDKCFYSFFWPFFGKESLLNCSCMFIALVQSSLLRYINRFFA